jgi:hypothetical protein
MKKGRAMDTRTTRRGVVAGLVLLACAAHPVWAEEVELRYNPSGTYRETGPVRYAVVRSGTSPQRQLTGEPKYASAEPAYFELKLGPKQTPYTLVLDESKGTDQGYDRLYVDANGDGDLRDAKAIEGTCQKRESYFWGRFTGGQVAIDHGSQKAPWSFSIYYHSSRRDGKPYICLHTSATGYYEGRLAIDGKQTKIAVVDANSNGSFNDYYDIRTATKYSDGKLYVWGDRLLIDLDGDGQYQIERYGGAESLGGGKYLLLDGKCYQLTVEPSGRKLSLNRADAPMGTLKREGTGSFSLALLSEEDGLLNVTSDGDAVAVPAGKYHLYRCAYQVKDSEGAVWKAMGMGTSSMAGIDIPAGKTSVAKFGPPLKVGVTARVPSGDKLAAVRPGDSLRLSLAVKGQAGELYSAGEITKAGRRLAAPTLRIVSEDGQEVASGSFRYG